MNSAQLIITLMYACAGVIYSLEEDDNPGNELKDYCSMNKFRELPNGLGFTKEVVSMEYANLRAFKAIHCCLRGYRSIEWYKDNKAYPWPGGDSHFILYPESANQTIYTQVARPSDAGRYSCQARNDTTTLMGEINLQVIEEDSGYTGEPLPTYRPVDQLVPLGVGARLFCEAYLGHVDLPDAKNSVVWSKVGSNGTVPAHGRISQNRVSREGDQIVGSYLEIEDVKPEDYGEYKCEVSNSVDQLVPMTAYISRQEPQRMRGMQEVYWRKALLLSALVVVIVLSLAAFYTRCRLPITLFFRDRFSPIEENDGKECDVLVCYHEKDATVAVGVIIPTLESRHCYKCTALELSQLSHNWSLEIGPKSKTARRVLVVASPSSIHGNVWNHSSLTIMFAQLASLQLPSNRVIVIALKDLPDSITIPKPFRYGDGNVDITRVKTLRWYEVDGAKSTARAHKFWSVLRLSLPPVRPGTRRYQQSVAMIVQAKNGNESKGRSRDSLEVLV